MNGWVKLHRTLADKSIWKTSTAVQKVILITLLMMANHEESEWEWKGEKYICKPGEMITSLESIREKAGKDISIQNVRTALLRFEKYGFLTNESTKQNRKITIENWALYQDSQQSTNKETNNQLTKDQQSTNNQLTTNKNNKNNKNERSIISNSKELLVSPADPEGTLDEKNQEDPLPISLPKQKEIIAKWNSLGVGNIVDVKGNRQRLLCARLREYGEESFQVVLEKIRGSTFLRGQNKNAWMITFDWLIKPNNYKKVLEGQYDDGRSYGKVSGGAKSPEKPKYDLKYDNESPMREVQRCRDDVF